MMKQILGFLQPTREADVARSPWHGHDLVLTTADIYGKIQLELFFLQHSLFVTLPSQ